MSFNTAQSSTAAALAAQKRDSRANTRKPTREEVPLTAETDVDAFSSQWHAAIGQAVSKDEPGPENPYGRPRGDPFADPDTPVDEREDRQNSRPVSAVSSVSPQSVAGLVIGAARSSSGSLRRQRTEDLDARSEPLRTSRQSYRVSDPSSKGWSPQSLVMSPQTFSSRSHQDPFRLADEVSDEDVPILSREPWAAGLKGERSGSKGSKASRSSKAGKGSKRGK